MQQRDLYEVLSVSKDADQDTIKKAYRKLAMQYHPDKNPGNKEAEEKFKEAATAYDVLSNAEKRARYDRFGHAGLGGMGGGGFHNADEIFANFSDIFSDFFGMGGFGQQQGRRGNKGPSRGSDLRYMCEVSLKEVITGVEKDLDFETEDSCESCNGKGTEKGHDPETCPRCRGSGKVIASQGFFQVATSCSQCNGTGQIIRHPCKDCRGRGRKVSHRKIRVTIPPGVDSGTRLRVSNEGEGGYRGGARGDLYVEVRVDEGQTFKRHGQNLYAATKISYIQALLGGELEVETLDGKKTLHIPRGTATGDEVAMEDLGLPSLRSKHRGKLIFICEIEIPKKLKKEEEKLLKEIASLRNEAPASKGKGFFSL